MILTHQVRLLKERHVTESFCELVFRISERQTIPLLQAFEPSVSHVDRLHEKLPMNGKPIVCVNVNAGETFLERRWMPEKFSLLIDRLGAGLPDAEFFLIGTNGEFNYVQQVIDKTFNRKRCYNLAGRLTIGELAALLCRCELMVSNDSGPLHLAAVLGTPCVALYGPESPEFYGPVGNQVSIVYKAISCSPCMNMYDAKSFKCPYQARCMREIEVAEVEHAVESLHVIP